MSEALSPKRRVLAALLGGKIDRIPGTSLAGCGGTFCADIQKATKIYFPEAHKDAEKMAKLAINSSLLTGLECVRVPFDFVEEPEALGCEIKWYNKPESLPAVIGHPYEKIEDLKRPNNFLNQARIPVVLQAIRIIREEVGDFLPISSLALGPLSMAVELTGIERFLKWIIQKPNYVKEFINFATDIAIEYAKAQYRAGSDIVQIADPMASGDIISPDTFREVVKPSLTKIAHNLGGIRVLHICGRTERILQDMAKTGFNGLSIGNKVEVSRFKPVIGETKILGNISSTTLTFGSPEEVEVEAKKAIKSGVDLLEPECGIPPIAPIDNIIAMVKVARNSKSM